MSYRVEPMSMRRYDELIRFWNGCEGLFQSDDDERDNLRRYLHRNPGMSLVVTKGGEIVATLKAGHDGQLRRPVRHLLRGAERHA